MPNKTQLFVDSEDLILDSRGRWLSARDGAPAAEIEHEQTAKAFHRALSRQNSEWMITLGPESKSVTVEDTPRFIIGLSGDLESGFEVTTLHGTTEPLRHQTLKLDGDRLTCLLPDGWEARFLPVPYLDLLKYAEEENGKYSITIEGDRIPLPHGAPQEEAVDDTNDPKPA